LQAEQDGLAVTVCIEAKADEPFGGTVERELSNARQRPATRFKARLDWLTRSLLGIPAFQDDQGSVLSDLISKLPYQLLSGIAGTLLEAELQGAVKAIFLVHEFRTKKTANKKIQANANALNSFLRLFQSMNRGSSEDLTLEVGHIVGPISIADRPVTRPPKIPRNIPLFVGKLRIDRLAE
jgi:hypothetical protein